MKTQKQQQQQNQPHKNKNNKKDGTSPPSSTNENYKLKSFLLIILTSIIIRLVLFYQGFDHLFSNRNEIATPLTSFKRLIEGIHLRELGLSPYAGSVYHQPPLVLLLFLPILKMNEFIQFNITSSQLFFVLVDCLIAVSLREITKSVSKVLPNEMKPLSKDSILPNLTAALYLFNPFTLFTCVGMSTIILTNLAIVLSLYFSLKGKLFLSVFSVSMSAYLGIYPIILIFPVAFILKQHYFPDVNSKPVADNQLSYEQSQNISNLLKKSEKPMVLLFYFRISILFFFSISSLFYLSYTFLNSWEFLEKSYKFTFLVEDLTPNIGLFWYYFIEVFDHFRNLFLFIFQYHVFIYTIPLAIRLKHHPLFYFWTLCAIIATFKSYPALGDTALHISLLPLLYEPLKGVKYSFIVIVVAIFVTVLAPILWQMWIIQGTGNANFYYTINLVFTISQVLLIIDALSVLLKLDYVNKMNEKQLREQSLGQQSNDTVEDNKKTN
ncbi:hypothetical protein DICPUDRAFT_147853 [Dictyostelium purpureum]|uniref:GPI transamidase subunit PIG-U family protein n=1 Tax=Dictyostelium purpureum TaxID=5786 RepID=F0Z9K8_DICPU|nr:uncharacterized protein DICPUDRAFT_147853 [Dictyostelium purpureum]EGC39428.1 hypothetical protein DICPUDRAFT_147853 [Dictyostelium purpureum]|eukprot:XP_003284102.1 hypothetical protein DICPUDRAFT_147853 [Dictyostelium purpureum]